MVYLVYFSNSLFFAWLVSVLYKRCSDKALKPFFFPALGLKILAGICLGLVFKYYYEIGDTLNYFNEGVRYADFVQHDFGSFIREIFNDGSTPFKSIYHSQPRALLMVKITGIFTFLTAKNYWLVSVYFSFFSFYGLWLLAERLNLIYKNRTAIILSLFVFPSILFWTSGITKESISMGCIALILWALFGYLYGYRKLKVHLILFDLLCLFVLWEIKYYYAGVLILVIISAAITWSITRRSLLLQKYAYLQLIMLAVSCIVMAFLISFSHPNFYLERIGEVIVQNHDAFVAKSESADLVHFNNLQNGWQSLVSNAPWALVSGLFRPWPTDGTGALSILAIIENLFLMVLVITSCWGFTRHIDYRQRLIVLSALFYCLFLAIFLTLSTPNFGTLVRYKVGFTPVLLLLVTLPNPTIKKLNQWLFKE